jgi:hypothetical protein
MVDNLQVYTFSAAVQGDGSLRNYSGTAELKEDGSFTCDFDSGESLEGILIKSNKYLLNVGLTGFYKKDTHEEIPLGFEEMKLDLSTRGRGYVRGKVYSGIYSGVVPLGERCELGRDKAQRQESAKLLMIDLVLRMKKGNGRKAGK